MAPIAHQQYDRTTWARAVERQAHEAPSWKSHLTWSPPPSPVADGRAQPKDRAGSKTHKIEHMASHRRHPDRHTSRSASTAQRHLRPGEEREQHPNNPPSTKRGKPGRWETLALWIRPRWDRGTDPVGPPAHRPHLVASSHMTVPQSQKQDGQSSMDTDRRFLWRL